MQAKAVSVFILNDFRKMLRSSAFSLSLILTLSHLAAHAQSSIQIAATLKPVNILSIKTAIGDLAVHEYGQGQNTIILWHSVFTDHLMYQAQIPHLAKTHRVLAIDGPGHGKSAEPKTHFSMIECARAVKEIMDHLAIHTTSIVGTSWGGLVAAEFALAYPDKVKKIVMLNTPFYSERDNPSISTQLIIWASRWAHIMPFFTDGVASGFFMPQTRQTQDLTWFHQQIRTSGGEGLKIAIDSVLRLRDELASRMHLIKAKTLVIAGEFDDMYPITEVKKAMIGMQEAKLEVLPSAHISAVDQANLVNSLLSDFLSLD